MITKYQKRMFENIYDLLANTPFRDEAIKELTRFVDNKEMEWDGDNHIISIGKRFRFELK